MNISGRGKSFGFYISAVFLILSLICAGGFCRLAAAAPVSGAGIASNTLTVTLQDEDGLPIQAVTLRAIAADSTGIEKERATTDQTGKAVFSKLRSGSYYFFADVHRLRQHDGYGAPLAYTAFKSTRSYFLSESRSFDLTANAETTFVIRRAAHIWVETYLQAVKSGKIVIINQKLGMQQIIPVASTDFLQIYLPMRSLYGIITIKDNDYDSWVLEVYAHERLRIQLL